MVIVALCLLAALCLVAALGNDKITSDAIGPFAAQNLIVSRHIKHQNRPLYESMGLGECACIVPGVMGDTGAEAFELVKGAVDVLAEYHFLSLLFSGNIKE